jgi:S-DNA-T family DNA segregation ATPase FtsK/SpoIIIE
MTKKKRVAARRRQIAILGAILALFGIAALYELFTDPSGRHFLHTLLGMGALPFAFFVMALGLAMIFWPQLEKRLGSYWYAEALLGLLLVYLATLAIFSVWLDAPDPFVAAVAGQGGGMVGWALSQLSLMYLGLLPTWALLLAMLAGGLYLIYLYTPLRLLMLPGVSLTWVEPDPLPEPEVAAPPKSEKAAPQKARSPKKPLKKKTDPPKSSEPKKKRPAQKAGADKKSRRKGKRVAKSTQKKTRRAPRSRPASKALPPLSLLQQVDEGDASHEQARIMAKVIEDTLDSFDIPARVVQINVGPTVTQFGVQPGTYEKNGQTVRVRISKIVALADDLALALAASPVRMEAPVPGEPYIGIEVPNPEPTLVSLRGVLEDPEFAEIGSPLAIPLGRDVSGEIVAADLHKLPHLLIAGATGSGKAVAMNGIISGLLFNNTPEQVKMVMVDPKRVEFPGYNGIPHLVSPVVTDPEEASGALSWLLVEMDDRYRKFSEAGVRNIGGYNEKVPPEQRLPYIVMFVDELADLMMTSPEVIEAKLVRLAQMARATGIHLVIATQRPSVDVVTGLIKANFPARLAFAVSSQIDSRVILDEPGAEKLLGRGDGIFMAPDSPQLRRIQGCFVSDSEIQALVGWWQSQTPEQPHDPTAARFPWTDMMVAEANADDLFYLAVEAVRGRQSISASALQRQLNIGYPKAARLIEELMEEGVIGPEEDKRTGHPVLIEDVDQ